jgi:hypothetical protein
MNDDPLTGVSGRAPLFMTVPISFTRQFFKS